MLNLIEKISTVFFVLLYLGILDILGQFYKLRKIRFYGKAVDDIDCEFFQEVSFEQNTLFGTSALTPSRNKISHYLMYYQLSCGCFLEPSKSYEQNLQLFSNFWIFKKKFTKFQSIRVCTNNWQIAIETNAR
jgi:hypothetical protein